MQLSDTDTSLPPDMFLNLSGSLSNYILLVMAGRGTGLYLWRLS